MTDVVAYIGIVSLLIMAFLTRIKWTNRYYKTAYDLLCCVVVIAAVLCYIKGLMLTFAKF